MNLRINTPYKAIWFSIPLVFGLSLIGYKSAVNIQYGDTFVTISTIPLGFLLSIFLGVIGLLYWIFRGKILISWMTKTHLIITIITCITIITMVLYLMLKEDFAFEDAILASQFLFALVIVLALANALFVYNVMNALTKRK